jgi:hypothetical protein
VCPSSPDRIGLDWRLAPGWLLARGLDRRGQESCYICSCISYASRPHLYYTSASIPAESEFRRLYHTYCIHPPYSLFLSSLSSCHRSCNIDTEFSLWHRLFSIYLPPPAHCTPLVYPHSGHWVHGQSWTPYRPHAISTSHRPASSPNPSHHTPGR